MAISVTSPAQGRRRFRRRPNRRSARRPPQRSGRYRFEFQDHAPTFTSTPSNVALVESSLHLQHHHHRPRRRHHDPRHPHTAGFVRQPETPFRNSQQRRPGLQQRRSHRHVGWHPTTHQTSPSPPGRRPPRRSQPSSPFSVRRERSSSPSPTLCCSPIPTPLIPAACRSAF